MEFNRRKQIRENAFNRLKGWTQAINGLPDHDVIQRRALKEVRAVTYGQTIPAWLANNIATEIADYVTKHWDPSKIKRPKTSRHDRSARDVAIVSTARDNELSTRAIASKRKLSASQVSRILRASGFAPKQDAIRAGLQADTSRALQFIEGHVPPNSIRAIRQKTLIAHLTYTVAYQTIADAEIEALRLLKEIEEAGLGISVFPSGNFFVVARGRTFNKATTASQNPDGWLAFARPRSFINIGRLPDDYGSAVWKDLLSVEAVLLQSAQAEDWRIFIANTTLSKEDEQSISYFSASKVGNLTEAELADLDALVAIDADALADRIARAQSKPRAKDAIASIRVWNRPYERDFAVLNHILNFVEGFDGLAFPEAIESWMAFSRYRDRTEMALLPDRNPDHIDAFLRAFRKSEAEDTDLASELRHQAVRLCLISY